MIKPEGAVKEMLDNFAKEYGGADAAGNKSSRNSIEIGVQVQPEDEATAQLLESIKNTGRYLCIGKDDVLVMQTTCVLNREATETIESKLSERLGVKVVLLDATTKVIGVVEYGGDTEC